MNLDEMRQAVIRDLADRMFHDETLRHEIATAHFEGLDDEDIARAYDDAGLDRRLKLWDGNAYVPAHIVIGKE